MAVRIDIPGIGEVEAENAASESTLRELVKLMGGSSGGSGGPQTGESNKNLKKFSKNVDEAGEAAGGFASKLASFTGGIFNSFIAGIGSVVGMLPGLAGELAFGGNKISDFTKHLPIGPLQGLIQAVEGQVELFQDLSSIGASFGNSMFGITQAALQAGMNQGDFAELLNQNSNQFRTFGLSVNDGAKNFGRLSKELRQSTAGRDLMAMGVTTQELNENLLGFNTMMVMSDSRRRMSEGQLLQGTIAYTKELDAIAKLTGKSRKQLQEENNARLKDARVQMAVNKMGVEEQGRFIANLGFAGTKSAGLEQALVDLADGIPNDQITRELMQASQTFKERGGDISNMTAAEFNNFIADVNADIRAKAGEIGEAGVQAIIQSQGPLAGAFQTMGETADVIATTPEKIAQEQAARDKATAAMTQISTTIDQLRSDVILPIIQSDVFQSLLDNFASFIPSLEDSQKMFANLKTRFEDDFKPAFEKVVTFLREDGLTTITEAFTSMSGLLQDFIPKVTTFFDDFLKDPKAAFDTHIAPLFEGFSTAIMDSLTTALAAGIAGFFTVKMLTGVLKLAVDLLNPFKKIGLALAAVFAVDELLFDGKGRQLIMDAWEGIKASVAGMFTGMFDFDFSMPNFKDYLPKWLGGGGKPISGLFGSDAEQAAEENLPEEPETVAENTNTNESTPPQQQVAKEQLTSSGETDLALLNTTATEMRDLLKRQNTILKNMGAIS